VKLLAITEAPPATAGWRRVRHRIAAAFGYHRFWYSAPRVIEYRTIEESVCDDAKNKTIQWLRTRVGRQPTFGRNHGKA
jgi:hypothetical protein